MTDKPKAPQGATPSAVFARQLWNARETMGISRAQLENKLRQLGSDLDRFAIGRIETGERRNGVTLDEAFAIATALDIAPIDLFFPREANSTLQVAPNYKPRPRYNEFVSWFLGQFSLAALRGEVAPSKWFEEPSIVNEERAALRDNFAEAKPLLEAREAVYSMSLRDALNELMQQAQERVEQEGEN